MPNGLIMLNEKHLLRTNCNSFCLLSWVIDIDPVITIKRVNAIRIDIKDLVIFTNWNVRWNFGANRNPVRAILLQYRPLSINDENIAAIIRIDCNCKSISQITFKHFFLVSIYLYSTYVKWLVVGTYKLNSFACRSWRTYYSIPFIGTSSNWQGLALVRIVLSELRIIIVMMFH